MASEALVCTPELCGMIKAAPLQCKGSIIKGGGFCGCTDACAKVCSDFWWHSVVGNILLWLKKIVSKNDNLINAKDPPPPPMAIVVIDKIDIRVYSLNTCIHW